jgi:ribosomal protein L40E
MESPAFGQIKRQQTLGRLLNSRIHQDELDNLEFNDTGMVKLLYMIEKNQPKPTSEMKTEIRLPTNTNRQCDTCHGTRSYVRKTAAETPYFEWHFNPFKNEGHLCRRCYAYLYHSNLLPTKDQRRLAREERINKRICVDCGSKTTHIQGKYRIWHKHSQKDDTWLCAKCYAKRVYEVKKKYKTKQER